mmetsp:Transcript_26000/g.69490  ORF Transcript_26000/g.69490 Transcript_26000/m.69490 type:complete len:140 (-) Transcript_26000:125-544(-)
MASIEAKKKEWTACLAKSVGVPSKCEKLQNELTAMAKASNTDCCIGQTVNLMKCTASSHKAAGCAEEFVAMRECNRAGGAQLVRASSGYDVAPGKGGLFEGVASTLTASSAPARTLKGMQEFGQEYAASLGVPAGQVRF